MTTANVYDLFLQVMQQKGRDEVARLLGLNRNTVARWCAHKVVPQNYAYDFLRMLGRKICTAQDAARTKDQFFTKPAVAKYCIAQLQKTAANLGVDLSNYYFVEPAAGDGCFFHNLPRKRRIGIDIDAAVAQKSGVVCADYLSWRPNNSKQRYVVVGNPPFGLRGHLALQFINHSAAFADITAFILPQLFYSDGKGAPSKRVCGYQLAHSEPLSANSFQYPNGDAVNVSTVFQVWTQVRAENIRRAQMLTCANYIRVYSLSDGGTPASTRNKKMLQSCDVYLPSTCFAGMCAYDNFEKLPHRRGYGVVVYPPHQKEIIKILFGNDWQKTAFLSTNGALNLRRSLIESVVTQGGYWDQ